MENSRRCIYETAHISVVKCPRVQTWFKNNAKTRHAHKLILSRILIKSCEIRKILKENKGGILTKILVFPLLIVVSSKLGAKLMHRHCSFTQWLDMQLRKTLEIREKITGNLRGVPTKLYKFHLLDPLEYQTLYHTNGKAQHFSSMNGYANYLIFIFMNI